MVTWCRQELPVNPVYLQNKAPHKLEKLQEQVQETVKVKETTQMLPTQEKRKRAGFLLS